MERFERESEGVDERCEKGFYSGYRVVNRARVLPPNEFDRSNDDSKVFEVIKYK